MRTSKHVYVRVCACVCVCVCVRLRVSEVEQSASLLSSSIFSLLFCSTHTATGDEGITDMCSSVYTEREREREKEKNDSG